MCEVELGNLPKKQLSRTFNLILLVILIIFLCLQVLSDTLGINQQNYDTFETPGTQL